MDNLIPLLSELKSIDAIEHCLIQKNDHISFINLVLREVCTCNAFSYLLSMSYPQKQLIFSEDIIELYFQAFEKLSKKYNHYQFNQHEIISTFVPELLPWNPSINLPPLNSQLWESDSLEENLSFNLKTQKYPINTQYLIELIAPHVLKKDLEDIFLEYLKMFNKKSSCLEHIMLFVEKVHLKKIVNSGRNSQYSNTIL